MWVPSSSRRLGVAPGRIRRWVRDGFPMDTSVNVTFGDVEAARWDRTHRWKPRRRHPRPRGPGGPGSPVMTHARRRRFYERRRLGLGRRRRASRGGRGATRGGIRGTRGVRRRRRRAYRPRRSTECRRSCVTENLSRQGGHDDLRDIFKPSCLRFDRAAQGERSLVRGVEGADRGDVAAGEAGVLRKVDDRGDKELGEPEPGQVHAEPDGVQARRKGMIV